ncbi:MAG TPA: DUF4114 domain-containing protein [Nostocaceae cyanobacterium]|nr:DUF4114 domain-containing protein [Nostocaceae cyanobacterium]
MADTTNSSRISVGSNIDVNIIIVGVVIAEFGGTIVTEGGANDTYFVALSNQPTSDVIITINPGTQLTTTPTQLTFTSANWLTPQAVTVIAVDDSLVEGVHSGTIQHSSSSADTRYNGIFIPAVNVTINDNDTAGVIINQSDGSTNVTEGGATDTYAVSLNSQPTSDVTITINGGTQVTNNPTQLTFTTQNWNIAQNVTVAAIDDAVIEGTHSGTIQYTVTSNDNNYNSLAVSPVNVTITDNDDNNSGVTITETDASTNVAEGGATDTYTVVLNSQPTANVSILLNSGSQLTAAPNPLVFTPQNWNIAQTVTVRAVDDTLAEGNHSGTIQHSVSSTDGRYNGITVRSVNVNITDNDIPGVTIIESGGSTSVAEGGLTDTYSLILNSPPTANVVINLNSGTQLTTNTNQLVFTPQNWNVAQTVTVTAVDDTLKEGFHNGLIQHTLSSTDSRYNGISVNSVNVSITDNDTVSVIITQSDGSTNVAEGGATDTYTVALSDAPSSDVTITLNGGTQLTTNTNQLVFTPQNWNLTQTVTVTAVDDAVSEGTHTGTIQHTVSSSDNNYNNLAVAPVNATIADNDNPGVTITESGGSTNVAEGGATDSYTIVLNSQPTSNVTILLNRGTQVIAAPNPVVFTPQNWNIAQTVTVRAVDDTLVEGNHSGTIQHSASSNDPRYRGIAVGSVNVNIADNDTGATPANVIINQSGGNTAVTEGGTTDSYTVVLSTLPTANVTVNLNSGTQLSTGSNQLVFTPQNWNLAQTVTVIAVNDQVVEGTHSSNIQHTFSSSDTRYSSLTPSSVNVTITDNDLPLIQNGSSDIFTIKGSSAKTRLEVELTNSSAYNANGSAFSVDELGLFIVDDVQGRVNGLLPGEAGYTQAALSRAQVLLSGVPSFTGQISSDRQRLLEFNSGENFRFYLVRNSSLDNVNQGTTPVSEVLFGTPTNPQITDLGSSVFSIAWEDGTSNNTGSNPNDFQDLVVRIQNTSQSLVQGTALQTKPQGEVLDLRGFTQQVKADFTVTRDGIFSNYIGFYQVADENGGIDTNNDGVADVNPGNAAYIQTAVNRRISGIDLTVNTSPGTATYTGFFQPGAIYAPFIIANGRPDVILDANTANDRPVYFPYLGANADGRDHVRLLGDNYIGFEDLPLGNTDFDSNDSTLKVNLSIV